MGHIFISYAREDMTLVDQITEKLEYAGCQVWLDRTGIIGGQEWPETIVNAIESAAILLIILSNNSVESDNVSKEVHIAASAKIPIIPVEVEEVKIKGTLRYHLAGKQKIRLIDNTDADYEQIIELIKDIESQKISPSIAIKTREVITSGETEPKKYNAYVAKRPFKCSRCGRRFQTPDFKVLGSNKIPITVCPFCSEPFRANRQPN